MKPIEEPQERCGGSPDCECPTCGSDNPGITQLPDGALCEWKRSGARNCPDPFHQPPVEGEGDAHPGVAEMAQMMAEWEADQQGRIDVAYQRGVDSERMSDPAPSGEVGERRQIYGHINPPWVPSGEDGEDAVPITDPAFEGFWEDEANHWTCTCHGVNSYPVTVVPKAHVLPELTRVREERDAAVKEREEVWAINQDLASDAELVRAIQERDEARATITTLTEERENLWEIVLHVTEQADQARSERDALRSELEEAKAVLSEGVTALEQAKVSESFIETITQDNAELRMAASRLHSQLEEVRDWARDQSAAVYDTQRHQDAQTFDEIANRLSSILSPKSEEE